MRVGKPEVTEHGQEVRIQAHIELEGRKACLWYSVERRYADYLTADRLDAFVAGLLLPAMAAQEDMHVEGPLSEKLYWNLTHYYMPIMASVTPVLRPVRIFPASLGNRHVKGTHLGAEFGPT